MKTRIMIRKLENAVLLSALVTALCVLSLLLTVRAQRTATSSESRVTAYAGTLREWDPFRPVPKAIGHWLPQWLPLDTQKTQPAPAPTPDGETTTTWMIRWHNLENPFRSNASVILQDGRGAEHQDAAAQYPARDGENAWQWMMRNRLLCIPDVHESAEVEWWKSLVTEHPYIKPLPSNPLYDANLEAAMKSGSKGFSGSIFRIYQRGVFVGYGFWKDGVLHMLHRFVPPPPTSGGLAA